MDGNATNRDLTERGHWSAGHKLKWQRFHVLGFRDRDCAEILMRLILKTSLAFAAVGYLVALGLYFAPLRWHIPGGIVYAICPAAYLTITVDPSFPTVALILGPINASVYGVAGLPLGLILWFVNRLLKREPRQHSGTGLVR